MRTARLERVRGAVRRMALRAARRGAPRRCYSCNRRGTVLCGPDAWCKRPWCTRVHDHAHANGVGPHLRMDLEGNA